MPTQRKISRLALTASVAIGIALFLLFTAAGLAAVAWWASRSDAEIVSELTHASRRFVLVALGLTILEAIAADMELLICIDALRRASAARITAVIPYFGYARQDRRTKARTPITAKLVANMLVGTGIEGKVAIDSGADNIGDYQQDTGRRLRERMSWLAKRGKAQKAA